MSFGAKRESKSRKKGSGRRLLLGLFIVLIAAGLFAAYKVFGPNTHDIPEGKLFYVHTGWHYEDVKAALKQQQFVRDLWSFDLLAKKAGYPPKVKAGKYRISNGMSNYDLVRMLRAGRQVPVKLVINKLRTKDDFIRFVTTRLEADSAELRQLMNDTAYLASFGLKPETALCAVIPDSYEFWWNTDAQKAFSRLAEYQKKFWTQERNSKAQALGLTPEQVYIVASIIEEETNYQPEKPRIASVYLNRMKIGMPLQADPTVRFAAGDFSLKRITSALTSISSPYNTYQNAGLPPGPICTPSKKTLEAVLQAEQTNFLYFCAKEDFSGQHRFAATYQEHQRNARLYQQALNAKGIR